MKISIIVPTYNEECIIEKNLVKLIKYCKINFGDYEIIVVDDSKDRTDEIVSRYKKDKVKFLKSS